MHAVAAIQNRQPGRLLQQIRRTRRQMPHDDALRPESAQRDARVLQRFALFNARRLRTDQRRVRAQALRRKLKRGARSRARFIEEQRNPALRQPLRSNERVFILQHRGHLQHGVQILHAEIVDRDNGAGNAVG